MQKRTMKVISLIFICILLQSMNGQSENSTVEATKTSVPDNTTAERSTFTQSILAAITATTGKPMTINAMHSLPVNTTEHVTSMSTALTPTTKEMVQISALSSLPVHPITTSNNLTSSVHPVTPASSASEVTSAITENPTTPQGISTLSSSTQIPEAGKTPTSTFSDKTSFTSQTLSTSHTSTTISSTKHGPTKTSGAVTQSTGIYKNSKTTKKPTVPQKKNNSGKVVAGLISGALIFMMLAFLFIYVKKWMLQKQQIETNDWAGPSPFLPGRADNGAVSLRSSNRVSFTSILPSRLSKRLSLLPEAEELEEIQSGSTFGGKHQENSIRQKEDENHVKESNGNAALGPLVTQNTGDAAQTVENSDSVTTLQTNDTLSSSDKTEIANLNEDVSVQPPTQS